MNKKVIIPSLFTILSIVVIVLSITAIRHMDLHKTTTIKTNTENTTQKSNSSQTKQKIEQSQKEEKENKSEVIKIEKVSEEECNKVWEEYFYAGITSLGNNLPFNSPNELSEDDIINYCFTKYMYTENVAKLKPVSNDDKNINRKQYYYPYDKLLQDVKCYFDLDTIDISKLKDYEYNKEENAVILEAYIDEKPVPNSQENCWGFHLNTFNKIDDIYEANITQSEQGKIVRNDTYTLNKNKDGTYCFLSGVIEYVDNNIVLEGNYTKIKEIKYNSVAERMDSIKMIGEIDGRILLESYSHQDDLVKLDLINPKSFEVYKTISIKGLLDTDEFNKCKIMGKDIIICCKKNIIKINKDLENKTIIDLPKTMDEGYDVSSDFKKFVYIDDGDLKYLNTIDNKDITFARKMPRDYPDGKGFAAYCAPRFVLNEEKVIATIIGYEDIDGVALYDLNGKGGIIENTYGQSANSINSNGMLFSNRYDDKTESYYHFYLDYKTEKTTEVKYSALDEVGDMLDSREMYIGENKVAFLIYTNNLENKRIYYINSLDINTLKVQEKVVKISGEGYPYVEIIGVAKDGTIYFKYDKSLHKMCICSAK